MSGVSLPSMAAQFQPYLQVSVELALAGSSDASGVAQAGAAVTPDLMVAELMNALPDPASAAPQVGSIINTYA